MFCTHCGQPLECYEGELYCPDCTRDAAIQAEAQATAEALAALAVVRPEAPPPPGGDEPPF